MKLARRAMVLVLLGLPLAPQSSETITARAGVKAALAEAKKWNAEAALAGVGSTDVKPDGTSDHWTYSFQAKTSRTCLRVVVLASGPVVKTDLGECTLARAIKEEFVDSPAALAGATAGGFKAGETILAVLDHKYDENLNPSRWCWSVSSPENDFDNAKAVMRGWCVDPATGKFVTRTAGHGGRNR